MEVEVSQKQLDDLSRAYRLFHAGSPLEVFFNHQSGKCRTVFINDEEEFLQQTIAHNSQEFTTYVGIQPRRSGLSQAGTNQDITGIRWLYLDLDPVKKSSDLCSSNEEKALAYETAKKIADDSIIQGYKPPVVIDSGNGFWCFFLIPEIQVTATNRSEIEARLKTWGAQMVERYSTKKVKIDPGIFDLRRITKIPGTRIFNKKEAPGRPQRVSGFITDHEPIEDEKLYNDFMTISVEEQQQHYHQSDAAQAPDKLNPERIFERCYSICFLKQKAESGNSLPHQIRLALSTISNGLDDLNHDLRFLRPILQGCPDYNEGKTRYYLQQNMGKSAPYSCEKLREITAEHFNDYDPAMCNCNLPKRGTSKPSPIRYGYPVIEDMAEAFNSIQWDISDPFQKHLQLKSFAAEWFQYFDNNDTEEFLRSHKKDQNIRVDTIKSLIKNNSTDEEADDRSISDILVDLADARSTYFKDADNNVFAEIQVDDHVETHHIKGKGFQSWLRREYYNERGKGISAQPLSDAVLTIEAKHLFTCAQYPVFVRIGGDDDKIFIDLCNEKWQVIEINSDGYQIINQSPVKFRRSSGMLPLPYPVEGGSIGILQKFLNLMNPDDWKLIASFIIACGRPTGPYPILCIQGEQGSAKSTACRLIRELIDPSSTPLRQIPRESRDLMISAINSWVLAFDNMSNIPLWLSDLLCRLATGGGMSIRTNYEDMDETLFQATRPIILNGINSVTSEPDLADRSIQVQLKTISEDDRKTEADIMTRFNQEKPLIFGAICRAVSIALKNLSSTKLARLPRMADFALWSTAAEPAYCETGEFMKVYSGNRQTAIDESLSSSPVMDAIMSMAEEDNFTKWEGSPSELLNLLNDKAPERLQRSKAWPKEPNQLTRLLNKGAPQLRSRGVAFNQIRKKHKRKIQIIRACENIVTTVTLDEKQPQVDDIIKNNGVTMNFKSSSPFDKTSSPGKNTVTLFPGKGDDDLGRVTMNQAGVTMNIKNTVTLNSEENQTVTGIFPKGDDGNDVSAHFYNRENIASVSGTPINDGKPKFRMVI